MQWAEEEEGSGSGASRGTVLSAVGPRGRGDAGAGGSEPLLTAGNDEADGASI